MRRCALLTLEDRDGFYIYDHLLFEPLAHRGWRAEEIAWSRPDVDWSSYDAVVIRSTWDYQNHIEVFLATLAGIEAQTRLFNPLSVCRWNSHKSYLRALAARGVPTVPALWEPRLDAEVLRRAAAHFECEQLIAKPCVGANADHTYRLAMADPAARNAALTAFADREVIVQPFVDSILDEGEYSLFYFGDEFSHAIRKRPAAGDFRVQEEHGGIIEAVTAPGELRQAAVQALAALEETLLYARIDFVTLADGSPALIEMELIEPSLYFDQCPQAPEHFAAVFERMTGR
jgi:glutathione synthase/RimK-type ligase-like ATP-grasp enzyme